MKKSLIAILFSLFFIPLFAQEGSLGLPGDNLNLYGVLNLFQKSPTLEEFEKSLNASDSKVNNLDLNGDGQIDYIHVVDNMNGSSHAIALRVDINETETQDVAVIEVDKDNNNQVHVQIVGDESLYGKDYIVEPNQSTPNPAYTGAVVETPAYDPPSSWAVVDYMYTPSYMMYVSPFHWGFYPNYWHPWSPFSYEVYYGYHRPYYNYYRRSNYYYSPRVHDYYYSHRVESHYIRDRYPVPAHRSTPIRERNPRFGNETPVRDHPPINRQNGRTIDRTPRQNTAPRPVSTTPSRGNETPRTINNGQPRTINNNPGRVNQSPRPVNNQPRMNQSPHPVNNNARPNSRPANQPARGNQGRKEEPKK
jgi:hypothetical protein